MHKQTDALYRGFSLYLLVFIIVEIVVLARDYFDVIRVKKFASVRKRCLVETDVW